MSSTTALSMALLDWLGETTLHVAILVVVVGALSLVLGRRLAPRWRYALWGLVAVRLLLPVVPDAPFSIHNLRSLADSATAPPVVAPPSDSAATTATVGGTPAVAAGRRVISPTDPPSRTAVLASLPVLPAVAAPRSPTTPASAPSWPTALVALWGLGALTAAGWWLVAELRFRRRLRDAVPVDAPHVLGALAVACHEAGVKRAPPVLSTDAVAAPALTGVLRPRVLLPKRLAESFGEGELLCVFRHEMAHLRAGDVLVNWVLAGLSALHWFNPLVWFAFARLRAERESVRDWTALSFADGALAPDEPVDDQRVVYGETLLRLLQHGGRRVRSRPAAVGILESKREMKRKITMIATFQHGRLRGRLLGAGVVLVAAAAALTGATLESRPAHAQDARGDGAAAPVPPPSNLRTIRVESESSPSAEDAAVRAKLASSAPVLGAGPHDLASVDTALRERLGVNVVLSAEAREAAHDQQATLPDTSRMTAEQELRLALRQLRLSHGVRDGVVMIGAWHETLGVIDRRFYDVRPILEQFANQRLAAARREDPNAVMDSIDDFASAEEVISMLMSFVHPQDDWTREGTSVAVLGELVVMRQTADMHAKSKALLELILNRGEHREPPVAPWKRGLLAALDGTVSLSVEGAPLATVAGQISAAAGVPIVAEGDCAEAPVTLDLTDVSARQAVELCARIARVHVGLRDGAIVFSQSPDTEVRIYNVEDIVTARRGSVPLDALIEMALDIEPVSWEEFASAEALWPDLLIVRNTPKAHAGIENLLATVRRALGE